MIVIDRKINPFEVFYFLDMKYSILFESNLLDGRFGRYSIVFINPKEIFLCNHNDDVFIFLEKLAQSMKKRREYSDFILNGGYAGYITYNFGVDLYGIDTKEDTASYYKAFFGYYEDYIICDHFIEKTYINISDKKLLQRILDFLSLQKPIEIKTEKPVVYDFKSNFEKEEYKNCIRRIKNYIYEGDVYQVNLSQQFQFKGEFDPFYIYSLLRQKNYGAYHAFLRLPNASIISTSPELFLQKRGKTLITRPIKGTIKRGKNQKEDMMLKENLFSDQKCRSELLMIVDLERNDFAKICEATSVCVEKLFEVEEYSSVFHLVSTIKGRLKDNIDFDDIIKAVFPGGSITGAPKLNAIKIIEQLEKTPRGVYTGSIGYVSNNFNMDFNIAIRTIVIEDKCAYFNVGGGIVWDSDEEEEYKETLYKGKPLFEILMGDKNISY